MTFDTGFFSPLVAGLVFLSAGVAGIYTGKHITKGRVTSITPEFISRRKSPAAFWIHVTLSVGFGIALMALAFTHAARV